MSIDKSTTLDIFRYCAAFIDILENLKWNYLSICIYYIFHDLKWSIPSNFMALEVVDRGSETQLHV